MLISALLDGGDLGAESPLGLILWRDRGRLVLDKFSKKPRLTCRNWECGVVIPLLASEASSRPEIVSGPPSELGIFDPKIPVPMQGPAVPMEANKPWFNDG